ncbi:putative ionotropic receptor iGluR [Fasciola hepatica]|uniref:Ionotropic receptor iGluR n=1 Tax=Fasciola hepatica TaxID=6192 RepID=A0A4E0RU97_FASHE|nr:putative ionotropic receptor iGluR [Fasciola hepatica]
MLRITTAQRISSGRLKLTSFCFVPGVIGVRLLQSGELDHVNDAIRVATSGILSMARAFPKQISVLRSVKTCTEDPLEIQSEPSDGGQTYRWNQYAIHLYEHMLRVNLSDGRTGQVEFDRKGDRVRPIYEIVNAQLLDPQGALFTQPLDKAFEFKRPDLVSVGRYGVPQPTPLEWTSDIPYPTMLSINMSALIWPGNSMVQRNQMVCVQKDTAGICQKTEKRLISAAPISFKKKRHLKVVTVHSIPFIYHRLKPPGTKCNESDDPLAPKMEVECKHTDPVTVAWVLYLLDRFSPFGQYRTSANTKKIYPKRKNKCIDTYPQSTENLCTRDTNTLESQRSDSRSPAADEAKTCLIPVASTSSSSPSETNEEGLSLSLALYFAWGVLLNSGIGEGTPRSFSARVLGMVWAGFAMIIVASYTANLAAFLVLDRPESSISGIDDMRLRNSQKDFTFATVRGSPVEQYFMRQMEYSTLYRTMESNNYDSIDEAIQVGFYWHHLRLTYVLEHIELRNLVMFESLRNCDRKLLDQCHGTPSAVRKGTLKAFIWDSARLNYEAAMDCDLITAGEVFGRMSYGLVMKKDSPWLHELSQAVLNFHERGYMETLDSRWIHVRGDNCERTETSPATLGLTNMAGVFIMVAAGILTGLPISMAEIACRKRRRMEERQSVVATAAIRRWRENVHVSSIGITRIRSYKDYHFRFFGASGQICQESLSDCLGRNVILIDLESDIFASPIPTRVSRRASHSTSTHRPTVRGENTKT